MGYSCNNKCIFCCNEDKRQNIEDQTTEEIKKEMIQYRKNGSEYVEFVGGEPTIRKELIELIAFAKKIGFKTIMFATNGRMLSNKIFAKKVIDSGITHIVFSIHGHNSQIHDELTQVPGSFNQLMQGLENVRQLGLKDIGSNTTIVKQNYKNLIDIGNLIYSKGIRNSEFIFVDPTRGGPKNNFDSIVPTYEEVSPFVNNLLSFGKEKNIPHWHVRYYPLCFIKKEFHDMVSETKEKETFKTEHIARDFINTNVEKNRELIGRTKIKKCNGCEFYNICEGYWKEYEIKRPYKDKSDLGDIRKLEEKEEYWEKNKKEIQKKTLLDIETFGFGEYCEKVENFFEKNNLRKENPLEFSETFNKEKKKKRICFSFNNITIEEIENAFIVKNEKEIFQKIIIPYWNKIKSNNPNMKVYFSIEKETKNNHEKNAPEKIKKKIYFYVIENIFKNEKNNFEKEISKDFPNVSGDLAFICIAFTENEHSFKYYFRKKEIPKEFPNSEKISEIFYEEIKRNKFLFMVEKEKNIRTAVLIPLNIEKKELIEKINKIELNEKEFELNCDNFEFNENRFRIEYISFDNRGKINIYFRPKYFGNS